MFKKLNEIISPKLEIRERLFRVILMTGLLVTVIAIVAGFFMSNSIENSIPLVILMFLMAAIFWGELKHWHTEVLAVLFGILLISVLFPMMFFLNGGAESGAPTWFVLGILYIFLMFSGKMLVAFVTLAVVIDIITYLFAYAHAEWILELGSRREIYYDSLLSVFTVGIATGAIMYYQLKLLRAEREVTLKQKYEIEEISESKDIFFANMSHEIRTPINTIHGLSEIILREKELSKEVEEDACLIQTASEKLIELVNDILDLSQIESGRMDLAPVAYRTEELFLEIIDSIRMRAKQKNLDFHVNIDENLPTTMYGDKKRIQQILLNLLTNGVKYTEKGSVTLLVNGELKEDGRFYLKASVADTGIGIKKEDLEKLFDPFRRLDVKKNYKIEGSGLGLSIAKQLLELMHGEIMVDSIYMNGSVFTVSIPQQVYNWHPIGAIDYDGNSAAHRKRYERSFEAPEARILVVDDDKNNQMVTEKLLRDTRVQIDFAGSGKECLEQTELQYYHLILLDHMMPGMDGIETLTEIRKQENGMCREVPVIALTANASIFEGQNYLDKGFDGYLEKPVVADKLEAEVLKYIPEELIEYRRQSENPKGNGDTLFFQAARRRKKLLITSDCVSDLPEHLLEMYDIRLIYLYIETPNGCFRDMKEIDSNNFSRYMADEKSTARAVSAPVEEFENFFGQALRDAEEVIHISLAKYAGQSYGNAVAAAKGFDHVHVIDSGQISCGEGMLVLYAAELAKRGHTYEEIAAALERVKSKVQTSFLLPSAEFLFKNGYVDRTAYKFCSKFDFHPIVSLRKSKIGIHSIRTGKLQQARKRYIAEQLFFKNRIDYEFVCVTHAGCSVEEQRDIRKELQKYGFKNIILQKASVSSACNSGIGTVGIAFMTKMKNDIKF